MYSLPITHLTSTGFYFSSILFFVSALLLVALYLFRWKSDLISLGMWSLALSFAGVTSWFITQDITSTWVVLCTDLLLTVCLCRLIPTASLFGVFFLVSMLLPSIFGLLWLCELVVAASHFFNAKWFNQIIVLTTGAILGVLIILNTIMLSWVMLVRYSSLYFPFSRLSEGWEKAEKSIKNYPWVSIHVPCYNEPPEVVIETINALARLQYPSLEVIVLDNNTKDPKIWKPVANHCAQLGERFRFYHVDSLPGAKAGALNMCLRLTSPHVSLVSVMDADYVAEPDFLEKLVPFFNDEKLGFVQSCQDYRDWQHSPYQSACYFEYETHFKLELSGQNEWDVTYIIGTVCLVRRQVLEKIGGWAEWCLTEDSEVAVRIHALGYAGYYLKNTFGYGLIPETFESYKQQRFRWTAGPVQQFQKHWRLYLPWSSNGMTLVQKFGEIFHSLSAFFSESFNLLINIPILGVCLWFMIAKKQSFVLPLSVLLFVPIAFVRNVICNWLSIKLLRSNWKDYLLSAIAARSLVFTRNKALFMALMKSGLKWKRTAKFKESRKYSRVYYSSRAETTMAIIYIVLAFILARFVNFWHPDVIFLIWLGIVNQAISFLCAPVMAFLSEKSLKSK
jgi:cellulose synthase/poly-beta-1,6-N-acetylglucosamine synthase-like glycosyltransferase